MDQGDYCLKYILLEINEILSEKFSQIFFPGDFSTGKEKKIYVGKVPKD